MKPEVQAVAQELSEALADAGKIIEGVWRAPHGNTEGGPSNPSPRNAGGFLRGRPASLRPYHGGVGF